MKKNIKVIAVLTLLLFSGIVVGATGGWKGSDNVLSINQNLAQVRNKLTMQNERIDELESEVITLEEHNAIVKDLENQLEKLQETYRNSSAINSMLRQNLEDKVAKLELRVQELELELEQAYNDLLAIDNAIVEILEGE